MTAAEQAKQIIEEALRERDITFDEHTGSDGKPALLVELPGERKQKITVMLSPGAQALRVEVFVCRRPDENHEGVYRFMLKRNRRLYAVAYTIDNMGDVYMVGRLPLHAITADEVDRLLGQILEAVDADFNILLELGFRTSIRREWAWRTSRGESLKNLEAFEHLIEE